MKLFFHPLDLSQMLKRWSKKLNQKRSLKRLRNNQRMKTRVMGKLNNKRLKISKKNQMKMSIRIIKKLRLSKQLSLQQNLLLSLLKNQLPKQKKIWRRRLRKSNRLKKIRKPKKMPSKVQMESHKTIHLRFKSLAILMSLLRNSKKLKKPWLPIK
jgi:hypothetical protein